MLVCAGNCHQVSESSFKLSSKRFESSTFGTTNFLPVPILMIFTFIEANCSADGA